MITLTIDDREPQVLLENVKMLIKEGIRIKTARLLVGDYLITSDQTDIEIVIEAKRGIDLIASKLDGRLDIQLSELAEYEFSMVALIGDIHSISTLSQLRGNFANAYPQSIISLITSTALRKVRNEERVGFAPYRDMNEFYMGIKYICKRLMKPETFYRTDKTGLELRKMKKSTHYLVRDMELAEKMGVLMRFPNIGHKTAKLLLDAFNGRLFEVLTANEASFTGVKGVGKKTYDEMKRVLK